MALRHLVSSIGSFGGMLPGEKTVFITRKHWFFLFFPLLFFVVSFLLPFLLYFYISRFNWYSSVSSFFWFLTTAYFLFIWIAFFYNVMVYLLTCTIITNKRIIKIETKGFFRYERDETDLDKIQDISVKFSGIFGTFLDFGTLQVQTAGSIVKFTFPYLPSPEKIRKTIISLQERT